MSRWLNRPQNVTLATLAKVALALGFSITLTANDLSQKTTRNYLPEVYEKREAKPRQVFAAGNSRLGGVSKSESGWQQVGSEDV